MSLISLDFDAMITTLSLGRLSLGLGQGLDRCLTRRRIPASEDVLTVDEIFCKANSSFLREDPSV